MRRFTMIGPLVGLALLGVAGDALSAQASVRLHQITAQGIGDTIGQVRLADSADGLLVTPDLAGMNSAGPHGAHVHENGSCAPGMSDGHAMAGKAAGGHYDPTDTARHAGPYGDGHRGDLPNLIVENTGRATIPVLAPRLTVAEIRGRALMVHAAVDRYADHGTHEHGKGGARMYCGVIE